MRSEAFLFCIIISISFVCAECSDGQININTASLSGLDELAGIGPTYAQAIIDGRTYSSLDGLEKVKGIGPKTLEKIKAQGLACVDEEKNDEVVEQEDYEVVELTEEKIETDEKENEQIDIITANVVQGPEIESIINLNSEEIVEDKIVYESKNGLIKHYAIYVFILFLVVVLLILLIKK